MPVVTDITRQQKRTDRYSIFVDDAYSFSLSDLELSLSGLSIGQELSDTEVAGWQSDSERSKALARAYGLLARRPRSRHEMVRYLTEKGYDSTTINSALERLNSQGLIDDLAFARQWVDERSTNRSRRMLSLELHQKGIDQATIDTALAEVADQGETEAIKKLIAKRQRGSRATDQPGLVRYLMAKGFHYDSIKAVLTQEDSSD